MLPRVSLETEIIGDSSPSTSKEMEAEPSIPKVAANQWKSSYDVGLFLMRDAPINDTVKYQILTKPWTPPHSYSFPTLTSRNLVSTEVDGLFSFLVPYGGARWRSTLSILRLLCPR
jgi:hypothetical protein